MSMTFNGTTSKAEHTTASGFDNALMSLLAWIYLVGFGESTTGGYIIGIPEAGNTYRMSSVSSGAANGLEFVYAWVTTPGQWRTPVDSLATGRWFCVAVTYDRGSTSNVPVMYILDTNSSSTLVSQTLTTINSPSGSLPSVTTGYIIGNNTTAARTTNGRIAYPQYWNRILSVGELNHAARRPGSITNGLKLFLKDDGTDISGNVQNATLTSVTVGDGPPCSTPWATARKMPYVVAAAGGVHNPYYYRHLAGGG